MKSNNSLTNTLSRVVSNIYVILLANFIEENACMLGEYHLIVDFFYYSTTASQRGNLGGLHCWHTIFCKGLLTWSIILSGFQAMSFAISVALVGWLSMRCMKLSLKLQINIPFQKGKKNVPKQFKTVFSTVNTSFGVLHFNCLSFFYFSWHKSSLFHLIWVLFFQGFLIAVALVMDYHLALCYMVGFLGIIRSKLPKFFFRIK